MEKSIDFRGQRNELEEVRLENRQLRSAYASVTQRLIGLGMLQNIVGELISEVDLDRLLQRILRSAINAVEGRAGALLLLDPSGEELEFAVVEGGGGEALRGRRMGVEQGIAGWAVTHNEPVIVIDAQQDDRFFPSIPEAVEFEVKSQICVPLTAKGERIGAIQVLNKAHGGRFDDDDLDLLTSFAAQSATAIENARLYQDLKKERDRIIAIEEDVRKRLARDLHDGPAQLLAAIIINIEFVRKLLNIEPEKVLEELDDLIPLAQKALRQVRTLLFDLRPVILETQGLVPALESYVRRQLEVGDRAFHLQVSAFSGRLMPQAERAIFSIVQEAVGNAKKHAEAQNVWIAVTEQDGRLLVGVRDDGHGFDVEKMEAGYDQRGSLGMLNMQERAEGIGGRLSIRSQPGEGTTVGLNVSLHRLRQIEP